MIYWFGIFLAVFSNVFYHISQKTIAPNANPVVSLVFTYLTAAAFSLFLIPFFPFRGTLTEEISRLNLPSAVLGISIVGLELGFLLVYRAGWNINIAGIVVSVMVGLCLIPVGYLFFSDTLTLKSALGIVLCIAGLILINLR
ncbi:MAG: EamA family transporter [Deferribacterales bacterium]